MDNIKGTERIEECMMLPVKLAFKRVNKESKLYQKLICWRTRSQHYHVELIIGDIWISSSPEGTHIQELQEDLSEWDILDIPDAIITKEHYEELIIWLRNHEHMKYDWLAIIFSQVIPFSIESNSRWICSECNTRILQYLNYQEVMDVKACDVSPGKLWDIFTNPIDFKIL